MVLAILLSDLFNRRSCRLPASEVFQLKAEKVDPNTLSLTWKIQPGYYLYKDWVLVTPSSDKTLELGDVRFPESQTKTDKLGHTNSIYKDQLTLPIYVLGKKAGKTKLNLSYQGCSENGFCYPPEKQVIQLSIDDQLDLSEISVGNQVHSQTNPKVTQNSDNIGRIFTSHHWPVIFIIFFGLGLLLSFTPCILPMIPVLSGIIVGHGKDVTTKKAFLLSLSYVLSMSLTYAIVGAIVALLGANVQISMQSPWTISIFSFIFILLALSMFGYYEFKLPTSWQSENRRVQSQTKRRSLCGRGHHGLSVTLILSPCVTAPLIGVLTYIAQTGNVLLGSLTLFILSLGMGAPLLLIGTSAGKWLPEVGPWMNGVKAFFGIMLLAVSIYLMSRILPSSITMGLWAILLIFSGIFSGALTHSVTHEEKFYQGIGIVTLGYGLLILIGLSMGGTNPLLPLANAQAQNTVRPVQVINQPTNLKEVLKAIAKAHGKPVLLDFYADWCTSCKFMEATTFKDEGVQKALKQFKVIKLDITANGEQEQELLKHFKVIAPPTFIFFDSKGEPLEQLRITGETSAEELLQTLDGIK